MEEFILLHDLKQLCCYQPKKIFAIKTFRLTDTSTKFLNWSGVAKYVTQSLNHYIAPNVFIFVFDLGRSEDILG